MKRSPSHTRVTTRSLSNQKAQGDKITMLTAYDATFAHWICEMGIDIILVGDSLGMVIQGHASTVPVSVDDVVYHTAAVMRGSQRPLLLADAPFMSCATTESALLTARTLMQAGANMIKIEGGTHLCPLISTLIREGVPVCGHLGLRPQSVNQLGGYRIQGRSRDEAETLLTEAKALTEAGISLLVLECVPAQVAEDITRALTIPVIGIGAGAQVDGQVLVLHDLLGITPKPPRFSHNFLADAPSIPEAIAAYRDAVKAGHFPSAEHTIT